MCFRGLRTQLSNVCARHDSASSGRQRNKRVLLGSVCALALAVALNSSPAAAKSKSRDKHKTKETEHVSKEPFGIIPKGPLQIFISIDQQKLHLYSDGTHVADAPVATGVPGHATPMGVFSVIAKDRYHHSNIYSNAPMPYMQRITWSGVALHEGPNVGHPASHGCIRMPHEFAARLWVLTKLGARVIIARPELDPTDFADSRLFVHKQPPAPEPAASIPLESVKTAQTVDRRKTTDAVEAPIPGGTTIETLRSDPPADPTGGQSAVDRSLIKEAKAVAVGIATGLDALDLTKAADDPVDTADAVASDAEAAKLGPPGTAAANAPASPMTAQQARLADSVKATVAAIETSKPAGFGTDGADPVSPVPETVPVPLAKPEALVRAAAAQRAPIAIFVSRRTGKIYVRQHFEPLFSAPITIEHPEQPLGTHVFTAMEYLGDGSAFRWNVVSLPGEPPKPARHSDKEKKSEKNAREKHPVEAAADPPPPQTPAQALARIEIPQDVIDQISALMVPGSSLIISDLGLGDETGEGTDFIVVTR